MGELSYDIYRVESESIPVSFKASELDSINGRTRGFSACRVVDDGRLGYYSTSDLSADGIIDKARKSARYGKKTSIVLPEPVKLKKVDVFSEDVEALPTSDMVEMGRGIIEGIRKGVGKKLPMDVSVDKEVVRYSVENSKGVEYEHEYTYFSIFVIMTDAKEGDIHWSFDGNDSWKVDIDTDGIIDSIVQYYKLGQKTTTVKTGKMTVMIHPYALYQFLIPLVEGVSGVAVKDGNSPLIDKIGEKIISDKLTITDDPGCVDSPFNAPFDREGVIARERNIVEGGYLRSFNHTLDTASEVGNEPTGGAGRSTSGRAYPGVFNLSISPGNTSWKDMLKEMDSGLFLRYMSGSGQANTLAGEYSMGVYSAFLVENGELSSRLKKIMITGNLYDDFNRVLELSSERKLAENLNFPYVVVEDVSVSGM